MCAMTLFCTLFPFSTLSQATFFYSIRPNILHLLLIEIIAISEAIPIKRTISAMSGKGVITHNRRTYTAENVDPERSHLNIEYCYTPIEQAYHELSDKALTAFNAKQKRKDRCIENYYEKIRDGKQEKPL